jgi:hypothetical protein
MGETGVGSAQRDLGEFTDAETKPDAWPSGQERAESQDITGNG